MKTSTLLEAFLLTPFPGVSRPVSSPSMVPACSCGAAVESSPSRYRTGHGLVDSLLPASSGHLWHGSADSKSAAGAPQLSYPGATCGHGIVRLGALTRAPLVMCTVAAGSTASLSDDWLREPRTLE